MNKTVSSIFLFKKQEVELNMRIGIQKIELRLKHINYQCFRHGER
jgi:hypothetical protein